MTGYWLMYMVPSVLALTYTVRQRKPHMQPVHWVILGFFFALFIGFRHKVGGDWSHYLYRYNLLQRESLADIIHMPDPGYVFINWLMQQWDLQIYAVNLTCGTIFLVGLIVCCMQQPRPWLAFTVAVPYLIFVVAMGYTRQGVALGLFFLAIASIESDGFDSTSGFAKYVIFITAATLFHKTALLLLALGIFFHGKKWLFRVLSILLIGYGLWDLLLVEYQETLWKAYVEEQMISEGARIRVAMNLVPSLLFLYYRKEWKKFFPNYAFWMTLSLCSVAGVVLVEFASTAVDRVSLYFTPIQVIVLSRLPILAREKINHRLATLGIVLGYAAVVYVWFNYATHAKYWLPYQNWLLL
jgi:hypothetical protein